MVRAHARALSRLAEHVAAALMAVIFVAFMIQIVLRYFFNWPVGWTTEVWCGSGAVGSPSKC